MDNIIYTGVGLLLAHFTADFILQTKTIIRSKHEKKWKSIGLLIHALIAGVLAVLLSGEWSDWAVIGLVTFISHWLIDLFKIQMASPNTFRAFLIDQLLHILVVFILLFYLFPPLAVAFVLYKPELMKATVYLLGILILYRPTSFFIENAIRKWNPIAMGVDDTLPEAGKWIGYMERLLIFIFMMMGEYSAIGFLIAAKSILRFRDQPQRQKHTEYILLGTLLSFTTAIVVSLLVKWLV